MAGFMKRAGKMAQKFARYHLMGYDTGAGREVSPVMKAQSFVEDHGFFSLLPYDQYDADSGLFFNDKSVSFCFEVLPQTGSDDDMATRLASLFTPLPPNTGVQWLMCGLPLLNDKWDAFIAERHIAVDKGLSDPFYLELAKRRTEFFRKKPGQPLFPDMNFMPRDLRLFFSITRDGSNEDTELVERMSDLRKTMAGTLRAANLPSRDIDAEGLIKAVWPLLNPECMFRPEGLPELVYDDGKRLKEQMTEICQHVRVTHEEVLFGKPPVTTNPKEDDRIAMRAFTVLQYPRKKELWQMANVIGHMYDEALQYPCPFVIASAAYTLDQQAVEDRTQFQHIKAENNADSKMARFQPELTAKARDWATVRHQIENGGALCRMYHSALIYSPRKHINAYTEQIQTIWKKERLTLYPLSTQHVNGLLAALPMTLNGALFRDLKKLRLTSTKTTVNFVDTSAVIAEWKGMGAPVLLLFGRRGQPALIDFYANKQGNYNFFASGVSGAGKSVFLNDFTAAARATGSLVRLIDVGFSYRNQCRLARGLYLEFDPKLDIRCNPFWFAGLDDELELKDEMRFLKPIMGKMASPNAALNSYQYSLIEEAITKAWKEAGREADPTLVQKFLLEMKDQTGAVDRTAFELGKQLSPFTKDGLYGRFFHGPASIELDNEFVVLELEHLKDAHDLRKAVLLILTSRISTEMYLNRSRRKLMLMDEAWQLLDEDQETKQFIEEGYRRARKYRGSFGMGTQGIHDAYKNPAVQAAYNNADFKIIMRQDMDSLQNAVKNKLVDFSEAKMKRIRSLRKEDGRFSELLLSSPYGDAVLRHIPDPFSLIMTATNADDYEECSALISEGYTTMQAIEIMMERKGIRV